MNPQQAPGSEGFPPAGNGEVPWPPTRASHLVAGHIGYPRVAPDGVNAPLPKRIQVNKSASLGEIGQKVLEPIHVSSRQALSDGRLQYSCEVDIQPSYNYPLPAPTPVLVAEFSERQGVVEGCRLKTQESSDSLINHQLR